MKSCFLFCCLLTTLGVRAQVATSVNVSGLRAPLIGSIAPATGGTLPAGTYYYVVTSIDSLGGQSAYTRGYDVIIAGANSASVVNWSAAAYAKHYKVYRSAAPVGGTWYLLQTTDSTTYTDLGSAGTALTPPAVSTGIGVIKGDNGVNITEGNFNVISSTSLTGNYGNFPAVQLGAHLAFGTTGIYGGNSSLIRAYQGITFEGVAPYEGIYNFKNSNDDYQNILLRPNKQQILMVDAGSYIRTDLNQGVEDGPGAVAFNLSTYHTLSNATARLFSVKNGNTEKFTILASGNVGIGTEGSASYKLSVNGNIRAKKIVVETGWSDYVFADNYKLRSIASLEKYISLNRRLPEIPSAEEVQKNGVSVGENQSLLLKKIEELTLYIIELKKENTQQQQAIDLFNKYLQKQPVKRKK